MARKAPRRTAERILQTSLALFNRYGEPGVSTAQISGELNISPGNLYYHYPAKDELVNALFTRYKAAMLELLVSAPEVRHLEDAWFFIHHLMERVWAHRFIYRDLNDLLSRNRKMEAEMKEVLQHKDTSFQVVLGKLCHEGVLRMTETQRQGAAQQMVILTTWWLSYAYVLNPRGALEEDNGPAFTAQAVRSMLGLCTPHIGSAGQKQIDQLLSGRS